MKNDSAIQNYKWAGREAAKARNEHDEPRAMSHIRWFRAAQQLEARGDRMQARDLFDMAYCQERKI